MIIIKPITIPLGELLNEFPEHKLSNALERFVCSREPFIEDFIKNKSIHSEKMGDIKSYFILDSDREEFCILGYYALTLKVMYLKKLSGKKAKKLHLLKNEDNYIPTYYIALLAKNDAYCDKIKGCDILDSALQKIGEASKHVGGRVVWVEAKMNKGVIDFYTNNGFKEFQVEEQEDGHYSHLLKIKK